MKIIHSLIILFGLFCLLNFSASFVLGQNNSPLHRLDFRLEGKSCASCLLAMQRKIKALQGVQAAVVMLRRPFGVSVVYEPDKIKSKDILAIIKEKEPAVKVLEISDKTIDSMPLPLIPPFAYGTK